MQGSKRKFGCLGYGVLVAGGLIVLIVFGLVWGGRSALRGAVERFTTEQAVPISISQNLDPLGDNYPQGAASLLAILDDPRASGEVQLTAVDLAKLVESSSFRNKVDLQLSGDSVIAKFSFPLRDLGEWESARLIIGGLLDRFLSGEAQFKISVTDSTAGVSFNRLKLVNDTFDGDALKKASEWVSGFLNSLWRSPEIPKLSRITAARIEAAKVKIQVGASSSGDVPQ